MDSSPALLLALTAPRDWQPRRTSVESWDMCNVGGSLGGWPGRAGPVNAFRAWTFLKGLLLNCISSKNLGKYGTVLESTRWRSIQREFYEMLDVWQSESHDLRCFSYIEFHWNTDKQKAMTFESIIIKELIQASCLHDFFFCHTFMEFNKDTV